MCFILQNYTIISTWIQNTCKNLRISHMGFFFFFVIWLLIFTEKILWNRINWDNLLSWYHVSNSIPAAIKPPSLEAASQLHISQDSCPCHHEKCTLTLSETLATQTALHCAWSEPVLTQTRVKSDKFAVLLEEMPCPALSTALLRDHSSPELQPELKYSWGYCTLFSCGFSKP